MKKTLILVMLVLLVVCVAACGGDDQPTPNGDNPGSQTDPADDVVAPAKKMLTAGTIFNAAVVNIRSEASTDGRIVDNARRGQMFSLVNYNPDDSWHQVSYRGEIGYVSAEYIHVSEWEDGEQVIIGTVKDSVNIRKNPSSTGDVIINALMGEQYLVIEEDDGSGWVKVGYPEGVGYISSQYLETRTSTINDAIEK